MKFGFGKSADEAAASAITSAAQPVCGADDDYNGLMDLIGDAHFVLLGEATHGTHEFYAERARITQRLIVEKGFQALAVEADWPDAWRVNRYVRGNDCSGGAGGASDVADLSAVQALQGFRRFPAWMWRNDDVVKLVEWLHNVNANREAPERVGFYGLDLYSLYISIGEVLRYLDQVDPDAARDARARYACFDHYDEDSQAYGYAANASAESCQSAVVAQLQQLRQRDIESALEDGACANDALFYAQQNAHLVVNAEAYYRTMFTGRVASWNLRDRHMADTLDALAAHLTAPSGVPAKIIVWAHNSHLGDARATESQRLGEWNLGQLTRERHGNKTRLIGFSTYKGTVTAASRWDGPAQCKRVLPALPGSYEAMLHQALPRDFVLPLIPGSNVAKALDERKLQRAIGVLYLPATERQSHYFFASLSQQFDAIIHMDTTSALTPLESRAPPGREVPETYPEGI